MYRLSEFHAYNNFEQTTYPIMNEKFLYWSNSIYTSTPNKPIKQRCD